MAASVSTHPPSSSHNDLETSTAGHGSSMAGTTKKSRPRKGADPVNTSKQIEDTIAQLERSRAGEKDQELEIEREVKKANRDISNLLSTLETPMSRIDALQKKYTDLLAEMKRTEREHIKSKKRADQLQKEKDASRSELNKVTSVKEKLEKLCRELQKENKKLKDDNKRIYDTETRMREELHARLEGMVLDVQLIIDHKENPESVPANIENDEIFRQKFKTFVDQYEMRELQFHSLLRTKELEVQYQIAKYEQQKKSQEAEANKARQLSSQVSTFSKTESELRNQLNIYVEKFKQVEDTLNNSNDLFLTFRKEMEEMSKKTKRLEKENHNLTRKHDLTNHNILQMAEERTKASKEMGVLRKKNDNLEKLCRGMQQQGRGQVSNHEIGAMESEGTESEYEYDEDDEEEGSEEYDEDTEEETAHGASTMARPFGPVPPPPQTSPPSHNKAHGQVNGQVNGVVHQ